MNYEYFLTTHTAKIWKGIGTRRRAGVAVPLFSLYSNRSAGIGEIPDIKYLIDWCKKTGMSIIQFLPLNEVGSDFAPYNSISTFALEPMYLCISKLKYLDKEKFKEKISLLKEEYPAGKGKVNYLIKEAKIKLLWEIFKDSDFSGSRNYKKFLSENMSWLKDFALYKLIKTSIDERSWERWKKDLRYRDEKTLQKIRSKNKNKIEFYYWLQWQLHEQFTDIKRYARKNKVLLLGDLPFLVSRDSADVWANQDYFKLELEAGAPPDMYFSKGQRWGMPPYNWNNIARGGFDYIKHRLRYAENFYDMFRIDHFIGLFRVWTIEHSASKNLGGAVGSFDPREEYIWGEHGRKILSVMLEDTNMLPCAEDLGTVPQSSYEVLWKFGVPGVNVQRWTKYWDEGFKFVKPEDYRINSVATVSTHDSSTLPGWWKYEAGTIEAAQFNKFCRRYRIQGKKRRDIKNRLFDVKFSPKGRLLWRDDIGSVHELIEILKMNPDECGEIIGMYYSAYGERDRFWKYIGLKGKAGHKPDPQFIYHSLKTINSTASIFSIQLLSEWLYLKQDILIDNSSETDRINFPGIVNDTNWKLTLPISLEKLIRCKENELIKELNTGSGRI